MCSTLSISQSTTTHRTLASTLSAYSTAVLHPVLQYYYIPPYFSEYFFHSALQYKYILPYFRLVLLPVGYCSTPTSRALHSTVLPHNYHHTVLTLTVLHSVLQYSLTITTTPYSQFSIQYYSTPSQLPPHRTHSSPFSTTVLPHNYHHTVLTVLHSVLQYSLTITTTPYSQFSIQYYSTPSQLPPHRTHSSPFSTTVLPHNYHHTVLTVLQQSTMGKLTTIRSTYFNACHQTHCVLAVPSIPRIRLSSSMKK